MTTTQPVNSRVNNNITRDIIFVSAINFPLFRVHRVQSSLCKFESLDNGRAARGKSIEVDQKPFESSFKSWKEKRNYHKIFVHLPECLHARKLIPNDRHTEFFALESRFAPVINLSPELI